MGNEDWAESRIETARALEKSARKMIRRSERSRSSMKSLILYKDAMKFLDQAERLRREAIMTINRNHEDAVSLNTYAEIVNRIHKKNLSEYNEDTNDFPPLTSDEAVLVWKMSFTMDKIYPGFVRLYAQLERELAKGKRCCICGSYEDPDCTVGC